ncbi:MAG: DEAD/DEAH box helicase, partial [Planctomycetota bacterium]
MSEDTRSVVSAPRRAVRGKRRLSSKRSREAADERKLSRVRKPGDLTLEEWQVALRRQYGRERKFQLRNVGGQAVFSEYDVTNPETGRTYRVVVRGRRLGDNFCSCPDFAVNTLGTCKHIEFTLGRLERKRAARKALEAGFQPPYSEIWLRYGAKREIVFRPGTECPAELSRKAAAFFEPSGRLRDEAYALLPDFLKLASGAGHEVRFYEDARAFLAEVRDRARLREEVDRLFPQGIESPAFRGLLKCELYPYQRHGALFSARAGRALNADDMGLGKTVQALATAEILARAAGVERVLVVAPTSLKHQWKREIERFTDRPALVVEGHGPAREALYAAEAFYKITNYDVVHRDLEAIRRWQPELVILDEAQRIKNWKTRTAQTVKRLDSPYALVLTGTPLENRLEELYSIVEFVDRFRLGPMFRFLHEHQHVDETGRVVGYRNLSAIARTLEPILVRRTKKEVLQELPERMEKRLFVPMTEPQRKLHDEFREQVARIVAKWRRYGFLSEADQQRLMILLQNMRMACDSTYLIDRETDHGVKADELLVVLGEILEDPARKVVVFSQWVRMHELVTKRLERRRLPYILFSGAVPGPKRKDLVNRFREDPSCRLFLSTDAGGVGLNLQHASAVVNLDLPWNPAVLEQRIGRVHRLGQHRPVSVVNFVAQGTIEEGILSVLEFKQSVFAGVLDGGQDEVFLGGTRLKRFMESVESVTAAIPKSMPSEPSAGDGRGAPTGEREGTPRELGSRV